MQQHDFKTFSQLIDAVYELREKTLTPKARALFFAALQRYSLETVQLAVQAHMSDAKAGKFLPMPADLIAQIENATGGDGRPGVEEAWALALSAQDENETVIWTQEMRDAFGICRSVLDRGDEVGARMAFKDAYTRMVVDAGRSSRPVKWELSPGRNSEKRAIAIERAAAVGRLPAPQVSLLLPAPVKESDIDRAGLERVRAECAKLVPGSEKARQRREAEERLQREADANVKREIAQRVAEYQAQP